MEYLMYMDESGNTGNPKIKNGKWNWGNQKHFALGGLYFEKGKKEKLRKEIYEILESYRPGLGSDFELKSSSNYGFRNDLLEDFFSVFMDNKIDFFIDITNKKFQIIKYINEYCVFPVVLRDDPINERINKRDLIINTAVDLYNNLPDELVGNFLDINNKPIDDNLVEFITNYIDELDDYIFNDIISNRLKTIKDRINNFSNESFQLSNLVPIKDKTNGGKNMSFLPNLDAYLNVVNVIGNVKLEDKDSLTIFHDRQDQFDKSIKKWTKIIKNNYSNAKIDEISFLDSKKSIFIQVIDFITGMILKRYRVCIEKNYLNRKQRKEYKLYRPFVERCNVVAPKHEQKLFFSKHKLISTKSRIPQTRK